MQCIREYSKECAEPRTTKIQKLTPDERKSIPTENLSLRYLARYGGVVSLSAVKGNKFFKAKMIRDDLMLEK